MAFDGNGNWISDFSAVADRDADIKILASRFDGIFIADIATSFENCLTKDGQVKTQTNFNANNYRVINVADPVNDKDAVNKETLDTVLDTIYPVGSIYITEEETCPLESLISGSTWEIVGTKIIIDNPTDVSVYLDTSKAGTKQKVVQQSDYETIVGSGYGFLSTFGTGGDGIRMSNNGGATGQNAVIDPNGTMRADMSSVSSITVNIFKRTA